MAKKEIKDKKVTAGEILELVGGPSNIDNVFHCMTRLRFRLKDTSGVSLDDIKAVDGVLGAQYAQDTLQVVIGPQVDDIYRELLEIADLHTSEAIDENLDQELMKDSKKGFSFKAIPGTIAQTFSNCMEPLVPLFVALGMLNIAAALIGPTLLKLVTTESDIYNNFYLAGQAIIYFLPVYVAITSSKYFKANTFISVTLAALMLYPGIIDLLTGETGYTIYGIKAPNVTYSGQIIPILLVVLIQSYVEKLLNKYVPASLKVLLVSFGTILIMMPLAFLVLGPLGAKIGELLIALVLGLYEVAGPLETMLVCAVIPFLTAFGIGRPIFFACLTVLMSTGSEYAYMPLAMVLTNFLAMGIAAGYAVKVKDPDKKKLGITCFIACALGGVSEPTLFGILVPDKKTYLPTIVGGAVSGLCIGLLHVGYYQFGPSNILSVLGFAGGENSSNFIYGCVCAAIAFVISFAMMLITYGKEKQ